ncbi:hypothetical protein ACH5RR_031820 [Cinchona calisaya]|uniref:RING-CH-type domain-containing protein n=1 Tax=Cinchona calisaya TaxID=153742 RepID=A0ABD2YHD8_9GENT
MGNFEQLVPCIFTSLKRTNKVAFSWGYVVKVKHETSSSTTTVDGRASIIQLKSKEVNALAIRSPEKIQARGQQSSFLEVALPRARRYMIKVKHAASSSRASVDGIHDVFSMEKDEEILEEEAVCRFCFFLFEEDQNIFKTKCSCKFTRIHEECAIEWSEIECNSNNCEICEQEIRKIPVTLASIDEPKCKSVKVLRGYAAKMKHGITSSKAIADDIDDATSEEVDEEIPEEEAVCRFCFSLLEKDDTFKTKCSYMKNVQLNGPRRKATIVVMFVSSRLYIYL